GPRDRVHLLAPPHDARAGRDRGVPAPAASAAVLADHRDGRLHRAGRGLPARLLLLRRRRRRRRASRTVARLRHHGALFSGASLVLLSPAAGSVRGAAGPGRLPPRPAVALPGARAPEDAERARGRRRALARAPPLRAARAVRGAPHLPPDHLLLRGPSDRGGAPRPE